MDDFESTVHPDRLRNIICVDYISVWIRMAVTDFIPGRRSLADRTLIYADILKIQKYFEYIDLNSYLKKIRFRN